jgi:hypothetical protein
MHDKKFYKNLSAEELWHLSKEAVENPQDIIFRFYDTFNLARSHERLWEMMKITLSSQDINDWDEVQRSNCIHFYELLTDLIKANYMLYLKLKDM